jgi:epoxyqueuosine reductase QueG
MVQTFEFEISMQISGEIKNYCLNLGADLAGIADLEPLTRGLPVIPPNLLESYRYGISVGIGLEKGIIEGIIDRPTPEYARHYREVNAALDRIAAQIVKWVEEQGFKALAIAASKVADQDKRMGSISHRAVARLAGLGWISKSLMLVNPKWGPGIRLATVLTDMPLIPDQPLMNRCGACKECVMACPAGAIKNVPTDDYYADREEALDLKKCAAQTLEFKALPGIGARLCGICIRACPYGR